MPRELYWATCKFVTTQNIGKCLDKMTLHRGGAVSYYSRWSKDVELVYEQGYVNLFTFLLQERLGQGPTFMMMFM